MTKYVNYNILQLIPDPLRGEGMNVGVVLHSSNGPRLIVRLLPSRLKALDPVWGGSNVLDQVNAWEESLSRLDSPELKWSWLKNAMAPLSITKGEGVIYYESDDELEVKVEQVLARMVLPIKSLKVKIAKRNKRHDLHSQITQWLKQQNIFSKNMVDLAKHRVVSGFPLNIEEEMFAEFALKNGSVHVIETLDFRGHHSYTKSLRNEASHKAMVLDVAVDALESESERLALISADDYNEMKPAISLLNRKATGLLSMESSEDRQWLADFVARSLHVPNLFLPENLIAEANVSASS